MTLIIHGIEFEQIGECNHCDGCNRECLECPHGEPFEEGSKCLIYDTRHLFCEKCGFTHQGCINFPHPWCTVVRIGKCNISFKRVDDKLMNDLPFVNNEYLVTE